MELILNLHGLQDLKSKLEGLTLVGHLVKFPELGLLISSLLKCD